MNRKQMIKEIENKKEEIKKERQGLKEDSHAFYLQLGRKMAFDDALRIVSELCDRSKRYRD